jgi:hypothetical protein
MQQQHHLEKNGTYRLPGSGTSRSWKQASWQNVKKILHYGILFNGRNETVLGPLLSAVNIHKNIFSVACQMMS